MSDARMKFTARFSDERLPNRIMFMGMMNDLAVYGQAASKRGAKTLGNAEILRDYAGRFTSRLGLRRSRFRKALGKSERKLGPHSATVRFS